MANVWTTVHPIPWRDTSFTYLPYWIYDIIVESFENGEDWRDYAETKYKPEFDVLKAAFIQYHDVDVIESRNGRLVNLLSLTPSTVTAKSPVPAFAVGDPALPPSALFDFDPIKSAEHAVLTVDSSGHAIIDNMGFVQAVSAGSTVVTATLGSVTETTTLTVTGAFSIAAKTPAPTMAVGDPDMDATAMFTVAPVGTPITLSIGSGGSFGTIVSNKLHAVAAGDVVVTGLVGGTHVDTITITITP